MSKNIKADIGTKVEQEAVKVNINAYASQAGLPWQTVSRLQHYVDINKLAAEHTIEEWNQLVKEA